MALLLLSNFGGIALAKPLSKLSTLGIKLMKHFELISAILSVCFVVYDRKGQTFLIIAGLVVSTLCESAEKTENFSKIGTGDVELLHWSASRDGISVGIRFVVLLVSLRSTTDPK